eukprot:TRINITY_DN607_c0_g2_i1.p1 TRINITY_DN607_c0_g2~~TRINITY_DN607_c0_g2_i1.p1  ORF type:complete len:196 (+),score=18.33 TRINITY_DN607_c0_g2_i1:43-630(+)
MGLTCKFSQQHIPQQCVLSRQYRRPVNHSHYRVIIKRNSKNDDLADIKFDDAGDSQTDAGELQLGGLPGRVWKLTSSTVDRITDIAGTFLRSTLKMEVTDDVVRWVIWGGILIFVYSIVSSVLSFVFFLIFGAAGIYVASKYFGVEIPFVNDVLSSLLSDKETQDNKKSLSSAADLVDVLISQAEEKIEADSKKK